MSASPPARLTLLALALAVLVRTALLADKPFWRDEAWVAALAGEPMSAAVRGPRTAVPVGFLALTAGARALPGLPPEITLRLVPLVAGLGAVAGIGVLARRLGASAMTAAAATWLAAGLPPLVYYSRELKPYSLDLLLAVLAPLLALHALAPPRSPADPPARRWSWPGLLVLLAATPWIAFGGVFAVGGALAACARGAWPRGRAARLLAACGLFGVSLAMAYGTVLRTQAANPRLRESWAEPMAAVSALPWPSAAVHGLAEYGAVSVGYLFGGAWPLAVALMALGAWRWPAPGRATLGWLFGATAGLAVTAALTGHYVLAHGRFLLFAAPAAVLLAAAGAVEAVRALAPARLAARAPAFAVGLCALVSLASAYQAIRYRLAPPEGARPDFRQDVLQDLEPVIAQAARVAGPGEPVLTSRYSGEQFRFYAHGRLPEATVCTRVECRDEGAALSRWLPTVSRRGWIILLAEEDRPGRRGDLRQAGFDVEVAGWARGARLWRLTRRP